MLRSAGALFLCLAMAAPSPAAAALARAVVLPETPRLPLSAAAPVLSAAPLSAPALTAPALTSSLLAAPALPAPVAAAAAALPAAAAPAAAPVAAQAEAVRTLTASLAANPPKTSGASFAAGRALEGAMTGAASVPAAGDDASVSAAAPAAAPRSGLLSRATGVFSGTRELFRGDPEIAPFVRAHRRQFRLSAALLAVNALVGVLLARVVGHFTDLAVAGHAVGGAEAAMILATASIVTMKATEILLNWSYLVAQKAASEMVGEIRSHLARHLASLSMSFYARQSAQEIAPRVADDVNRLVTRNWDIPIGMPYYFLRGALSLAMLVSIDWRVALGVVPAAWAFNKIAVHFGKKLEAFAVRRQRQKARMVAQLGELLSMIEVHKVFGSEEAAARVLDRSIAELTAVNKDETGANAANTAVIGGVGFVLSEALFFGGAWLLFLLGWPSIGLLSAMGAYAGGVQYAISSFAANRTASREAAGATKWVLGLLAAKPEITDAPDAVDPGPLRGELEFRDVVFGYDPARPILKGVSFKTKPGQTVAFVGGTGSGKTTILRLLARLYDPQSGSVSVDGRDLRTLKLDALKRRLAIVPQDSALFGGTIRENLLAVEPDARDEALRAALLKANAGFVFDPAAFPKGLDTPVGDRGSSLSGGQRQRVAIARAILRDPDVLILDEATSALDNESELAVQDALKTLMRGRTTFVVAHRLTTVQNADVIHVLDGGRVVESGAHAELLARRGKYWRLWTAHDAAP